MKSNKNTYSKFKAYLQNKLSDKDRYVFEKNEQKNYFEQEALEGIDSLKQEIFFGDVEKLRSRISNKKNKKGIVLRLRKFNAAASIFILIGMASYFYWTNRPDLPKDTIFETPVLQEPIVPQDQPELEEEIIMEETTISPPQQSKQIELTQDDPVLEETVQEEVVERKKAEKKQRKIEPITPQTQDAIVSIEIEEELALQDTEIIPEQINGTVLGKDGNPLPGVTVMVEDSSKGSVTDFDGNFKIEGDSTATLVFDYLGFEQAIKPATDSMLVVMQEDHSSLEEVVVVGYGTARKSKNYEAPTINPSAIAPQGDLEGFKEWIDDEFDYDLLDDHIITIYLEFKILQTGEISKIRFKNKVKKKIKKEIKTILATSDLWTPAEEDGVLKEETILIKLEF